MRTILKRTLSTFGIDTVEADNGRTGLEVLRAMPVPPDVVLVDWNMPDVDGLEFVAEVRSQPAWRDIRIMMVTNESEQRHIVRALAAGAHDYLIKPFTRDTIQDRLRQLGLVGSEAGDGLPSSDVRVFSSMPVTAGGARAGIDADGSEARICDCCANAGTVAYYPLDEPLEQGDDGPLSFVDRIYVCERCFQLVETGHWSHLRGWIGSATDKRAVRHLWMGLRRHYVGSPVPSAPSPALSRA